MTTTKVPADVLEQAKGEEWYLTEPEEIEEPIREVLEKYSGIPPDKIIPHVRAVREKAFEVFPYPCLGRFNFLVIQTLLLDTYPEILQRVKAGEKYLDVGCCFGQEVRKLAFDGAPTANLYGSDISQSFLDYGYDLFRDRDTFKGKFLAADALEPSSALQSLTGQLGIICANSFFHLFAFDKQVRILTLLIPLFKAEKGNLLVGSQVGCTDATPFELNDKMGSFYAHNIQTWDKLWKEASEATGTKWDVKASLDEDMSQQYKDQRWVRVGMRRMRFTARRL